MHLRQDGQRRDQNNEVSKDVGDGVAEEDVFCVEALAFEIDIGAGPEEADRPAGDDALDDCPEGVDCCHGEDAFDGLLELGRHEHALILDNNAELGEREASVVDPDEEPGVVEEGLEVIGLEAGRLDEDRIVVYCLSLGLG